MATALQVAFLATSCAGFTLALPAYAQSSIAITTSTNVAQSEKSLPPITVTASESENYLASETSTATRTNTLLRDVPQSITVVTRQAIRDQNMLNIADVVRYVPGVGMAQGEGNRETPIFRGNSSTSDFFIDGVRDDVQYYRDLYNIERVEVLKGPNGMIFGRGGSGGVINRVSKEAGWQPVREASVQAGSYDSKRATVDIGQGINESVAFRLNAMIEDADSYRDGVTFKRYGINPTVTIKPDKNTRVVVGAEYFKDERIADRGIPSFRGRPIATDESTFFGDPDRSPTDSTVKAFNALVERDLGNGVTLRNRTRYADYDKFYQNVFPGAVNAAGTTVSISAYNQATQRENLFNQTDLIFSLDTGGIKHKLLAGVELGRQETDNFRSEGFFPGNATSTTVPVSNPRTSLPLIFRQNATSADNSGTAKVAGLYLQDQIELSRQWEAVLGLRYDKFDVDFRNNRTGAEFSTSDNLLSPRVGLIYKPIQPLSLYANYSMSYVPRAGEQLASLSLTTQALDPEEFKNYEIGAKWDVRPDLALTAAVYRLDRKNVAVTDPSDSTRSLLVDGQRSKGVELGVNGQITKAWSIMGGYAYQKGEITATQSATVREGATLAQVPKHTFSLWNRYDFSPTWGIGLGVFARSDMYASEDNTVRLPGYARLDGAVFYKINKSLRAQLNVENLANRDYYVNAHNNNNITPGSPTAARIILTGTF